MAVGTPHGQNTSLYSPYLGRKGEGTEVTMSQPPQDPPTAPNSVESTESGPTSVLETLTTEGGDGDFGPGEDVQARLGEAGELKQEGNDLFRCGKWNEALQSYRNGLAQLPKRKNSPTPPPVNDKEGDTHSTEGDADRSPAEADRQNESTAHSNVVDSPLEGECAKARSVLSANIAACHMKLASARRSRLRFECLSRI